MLFSIILTLSLKLYSQNNVTLEGVIIFSQHRYFDEENSMENPNFVNSIDDIFIIKNKRHWQKYFRKDFDALILPDIPNRDSIFSSLKDVVVQKSNSCYPFDTIRTITCRITLKVYELKFLPECNYNNYVEISFSDKEYKFSYSRSSFDLISISICN